MASQFLGATPRRWLEYLVAILLGQVVYYFSFVPHLPNSLRHHGSDIDLGLGVDFLISVAIYGLIRLGAYLQRN